MSSTRTREFVPQSAAIGSALELTLAAAIAALMALLLISPMLPAGAVSPAATRSAAAIHVTLPTVVISGQAHAGTTTLADLDVTKAAPNQVNLAQ